MRSGGGKQKGASFERWVCVELSRWISDGQREDVYWRSAMSGGRATVGRQKGKTHSAQVGDISCIHHSGSKLTDKFSIECKHLKSIELESAIKGNGMLPKIWKKLNGEARFQFKDGLLIMKQNNWPVLLGMHPNTVINGNLVTTEIIPIITFPRLDLNVYYFDDWLNHIPSKWFQL